MFNINRFRAEIETHGVLRTNTFEAGFPLPEYLRELKSPLGITEDRMLLRCETAQIPGMAWNTLEGVPRIGYGPIEGIPYSPIYDDVTLTFLTDSKGLVHKLFYTWFNTIVNLQSVGQTALKDNNRGPTTRAWNPYEVGYRNLYTTILNIFVYDTAAIAVGENRGLSDRELARKKVMTITLFNAYPKLMPSIDMSWSSNDDVVRLPIPFSYTDFAITYEN